jgi:hypothetical protein
MPLGYGMPATRCAAPSRSPLFVPGSAWNQIATTAAILPDNDQQILVTLYTWAATHDLAFHGTVPITSTEGVTKTISVSLLVGGVRLYLPLILKNR